MDQVQPSIKTRVGQRFIAGVNDGAIVLHPFKEIILDVIRALADLERNCCLRWSGLSAKLHRPNGTDAPRTREEDAQRQEREQREDVFLM